MKKIVYGFALALAFGSTTHQLQAQGLDPADLSNNNLLKNPSFVGTSCFQDWQIEVVGVACNAGAGFCWLNHNNSAGDPAVKQTLTGLTIGAEYKIMVGWRGGDHAGIHGVKGAKNIFAVDIDGKEIKRLTTSTTYTAWMVNEKAEADAASATPITFKATATSHTIRFRGEVGADGDVLLAWVKVSPAVVAPVEPVAPQYYDKFGNPVVFTVPNTQDLFDKNGVLLIPAMPVVPCEFKWSSEPVHVSGSKVYSGTINNVKYTLTGSDLFATPAAKLQGHSLFIAAGINIPEQKCITNNRVTSNVIEFEQPMKDPVLVFGSIGDAKTAVPILFDQTVEVIFENNIIEKTPNKIVGKEGHIAVRIRGIHSKISFKYTVAENSVNFLFGAEVCK